MGGSGWKMNFFIVLRGERFNGVLSPVLVTGFQSLVRDVRMEGVTVFIRSVDGVSYKTIISIRLSVFIELFFQCINLLAVSGFFLGVVIDQGLVDFDGFGVLSLGRIDFSQSGADNLCLLFLF